MLDRQATGNTLVFSTDWDLDRAKAVAQELNKIMMTSKRIFYPEMIIDNCWNCVW